MVSNQSEMDKLMLAKDKRIASLEGALEKIFENETNPSIAREIAKQAISRGKE